MRDIFSLTKGISIYYNKSVNKCEVASFRPVPGDQQRRVAPDISRYAHKTIAIGAKPAYFSYISAPDYATLGELHSTIFVRFRVTNNDGLHLISVAMSTRPLLLVLTLHIFRIYQHLIMLLSENYTLQVKRDMCTII